MRQRKPSLECVRVGNVVGVKEIAQRLNYPHQTVSMWNYRGRLPATAGEVSGVPFWDWVVIQEWAARTQRYDRAGKPREATGPQPPQGPFPTETDPQRAEIPAGHPLTGDWKIPGSRETA